MKKLIDRLKRRPPAPKVPPPADADAAQPPSSEAEASLADARVDWSERAAAIGAQPLEPGVGLPLLAAAWAHDPYIRRLGADDLALLAGRLQFFSAPADRQLMRQDEAGSFLLVTLDDGSVAVGRLPPPGGRVRVADALAGDVLGEMSLLDAGPRFSTVTTRRPARFAVLDAASFEQLLADHPRIAVALLACLSRRLSLRLRQVSARLGALLSPR